MAALTAAEYRAFVQRTPGPHGIHFDLLKFSRDCNPKDVQAQGEANGFGPVWRASVHMSFFPECVMVLRSVQPGTGTGPRPLEGNRSALVKADLMRAFVPAVQALLRHTLVMPPSPLEAVPGAPFLTFPQAFTLVKGNMETCAEDLTHAVFAAALWKTRRATLESWSDGNMDKWLTHALQRDVATTAMRQRPRTVGQDLCDGVATLRNEILNAAFLVYVSMGCRRQWRAVMAGVEDVLPHMGAVVAAFGDSACAFHAPASFVHRAETVLARAWDAWALQTPRFVYDGIGAAVMRAPVAETASPGGLAWVLVAAYVVAQRLDQAQVQGLCAEAAADGWSAVRLPAIALAAPAPAPALPSPPLLLSKADTATAAAVAATAACTGFDTSCCPPGLCALQDLLVLAPRRCEGGPKFIVDAAGSLDVGGFGVRVPPAPYEDLVFLAESAVPVYMSVEVAKTKKDPRRVGKCSVLDADVARVKAFAQPDRVFAMLDGAYSAPLADTVASARAFAAAAVFMGPAMDDVWNLSPGCVPHRELQAVLVKELQESGLVHTPCTLSTSWSANASSALWWWMFKRTSLCSGADVEEPADALARGCVRTCLACCCELAARAPALGPLLQWGAFVRLWRRARQQAPRTHLPDDPCTAEVFIKIETADTVSVHDVDDVPELLPEYQHVLAVQAVHDCLFEGAVSRQSAPFVDEDVTQACVQRLVFRGDWTTTAARDAFCALVRKGGGGSGGVAAEGVWTGPHCKASSWDSPALLPFQRPGDLGTDVLSRTQAHALDMAATCDSRSAVGTVLFAHPVAMVSSLIARFAALVKSAKSRS